MQKNVADITNIYKMQVKRMTKDQVIAILRRSGEYVSGEEISRSLGISRAAVNTAVMSLRNDGYEILSSTNKGYMLNNMEDKLNLGELMALLPAERSENIVCLNTVDSTNNYLRTMAQNGAPDGTIVVSNEQTKGKGRLGRSFSSPSDSGVYFSILMRPGSIPAQTASITAWVAVAMCNAIEAVSGVRPGIKWVNDLVINGKKVCGILTEMSVETESGCVQYLIIGIGINVNEQENDFPEDIRNIAGSLAIETGRKVNRAALVCHMIESLDKLRCGDWPGNKKAYLEAYRNNCITIGREVRVLRNGSDTKGYALDIDDDFGIIIKFDDGRCETFTSGEVSVRGLYGYV